MWRRVAGALLVLCGCVSISLEHDRPDFVIASIGGNHGLHFADVFGGALAFVGVLLLWR
jgi:hypothetical protein